MLATPIVVMGGNSWATSDRRETLHPARMRRGRLREPSRRPIHRQVSPDAAPTH